MRPSDEDNGDDSDDNENGKQRARKRISKSNSKEASKKDTVTSDQRFFDTEVLVRVILSRLVELIGVCQPDIRVGAKTVVVSMAYAILDKSIYLNEKLQIATR